MTEEKKAIPYNPFVGLVNISCLMEKAIEESSKKKTGLLGAKTCVHTRHKEFETYTFGGIEMPEIMSPLLGAFTFIVTKKDSPVLRLSLSGSNGAALLSTFDIVMHPSTVKQVEKIYGHYQKKNGK